ncbi:MAG: ABC transporter ATP-binding protein [Pseudomonadota bacterium]
MPPILDLQDLRVETSKGRVLLSVERLTLDAGQTLGVAGPSGAGKSTLLFVLAGLTAPTSGRVTWRSEDLYALSPARRTAFRGQNIGMIFQDFLLFDELDPMANAGLSALFQPKARRAEVRAQAQAGLTTLAVPDTGRTVASFSGGERQRVAVARALANGPEILLADEPTASLPREAANALIDALLDDVATTQRTLIVVSHDPALLARMDQVLELRDGHAQHA